MARRTVKGWLNEVSSIVVITLLRKELNVRVDTLNTLIKNTIKRNIEGKERKNDIQYGSIT